MTRTQKAILSFLSVLACFLLAAIGYLGFRTYSQVWQKPLGPALQLATPTFLGLPPTWTPTIAENAALQPVMTGAPSLTPIPTNTPFQAARCGAPPGMTILAIGSDARADTYKYGLADVIRIVRVDFVTPRVAVLEFPRDLWVEIPEIADNLNGQDHEKLNQAYLYGNPGDGFKYWDDPSAGSGLLARTLALNFGVHVDHYAAVNMQTFVKLVDAMDGIDIDLPETVDGRTADDTSKRLLFLKGKHHLNGTQALTLARTRIDGVFSRADHQNRVLCALRDKLASPKVIANLPKLIRSFQDAIQTDLSPEQLGQLACIGTQILPDNILFASFPQELFKQSRVYDPVFKKNIFVWDVDFNILRDHVVQFQVGAWPTAAPPSPDEPETVPFCP